jgi:5-methyltetrahydrofolate--homocysteine methyltransferase
MTAGDRVLEIIGENFNTTRRIRATSARIVRTDGKVGLSYAGTDGGARHLDITGIFPKDPAELRKFQVPHVAYALRIKDLDYIAMLIQTQAAAGATIIDLCLDEISVDPEERHQWMRWLIPVAQSVTDLTLSIDSSDPNTVMAGLEVYDLNKSRPAINSVNLEEGRQVLIGLAKKYHALVFANASGRENMPQDDRERVANLQQIMAMMDAAEIPMGDRYLDPLAFPIGAGSQYGNHYLDAVCKIRELYPEVHIFGGHSNTSFGLPQRRVVNNAFVILSILAGCDTLMIDPIANPPADFVAFKLASDVLLGRDDFAMRFMTHMRGRHGLGAPPAENAA